MWNQNWEIHIHSRSKRNWFCSSECYNPGWDFLYILCETTVHIYHITVLCLHLYLHSYMTHMGTDFHFCGQWELGYGDLFQDLFQVRRKFWTDSSKVFSLLKTPTFLMSQVITFHLCLTLPSLLRGLRSCLKIWILIQQLVQIILAHISSKCCWRIGSSPEFDIPKITWYQGSSWVMVTS